MFLGHAWWTDALVGQILPVVGTRGRGTCRQLPTAWWMGHVPFPLALWTKLFHLVVCFILGDSPASEFYMPTFRNTLFHLHRQVGECRMNSTRTYLPMKMEQSVPKRRHIKFRRRGITQKKAYNIQEMAKVWNQELFHLILLFLITLILLLVSVYMCVCACVQQSKFYFLFEKERWSLRHVT